MATIMKLCLLSVLVFMAVDQSSAVALGDGCSTNADCTGDNQECIGGTDKTCTCKAGYKANNNACVMKVPGDDCTSNGDCLYDNSMCNTNSQKCACMAGYIRENNQCKINELDGSCESNDDCKVPESECSGAAGAKTCSCKDGYKKETSTECTMNGAAGLALHLFLLVSCVMAAFYYV